MISLGDTRFPPPSIEKFVKKCSKTMVHNENAKKILKINLTLNKDIRDFMHDV